VKFILEAATMESFGIVLQKTFVRMYNVPKFRIRGKNKKNRAGIAAGPVDISGF
jgi:hypothetical protein